VRCTGPVFSGHSFHGGTLNRGDAPRMAMHSAFVRRNVTSNGYEQGDAMRLGNYERLCSTPRGRAVIALLDVARPGEARRADCAAGAAPKL
jgi:hypothetical protein